ncbi:carbohydrate ABC transporter permease [Agrococcus baldri]|uniref:Sugar ABC transporter permease n=1 Tax=Agrococcus baldri TaxID=153730 RepID=A0AA87RGL2_9MICO|nr:sugar ABC transporter permease [Agrococcus baldri]GEK79218.1 sugar ABC transporter permease [Agrococcus baldri]
MGRSSVARFVPWWFAAPAVLLFAVLMIWPSVDGVILAFHDWNGVDPQREFVGLENLIEVFTHPMAFGAVLRTLLIAFTLLVTRNVLGLLLALALNTSVKSRVLLRTVFFAPAVMSSVVLGYTYKFIFGSDGPVNQTLRALGAESVPNWLGEPTLAIGVIIFVITWQTVGSAMVIYLAGLQSIPQDVLEAASIDGAGAFRRFFSVSLPYLAPAITVNMVLTLITGLRVFDDVYVLTGGGPANQTQTISTLLVQEAFAFGDYGTAAALAVVLSVLIAALTAVQFRFLKRQRGLGS